MRDRQHGAFLWTVAPLRPFGQGAHPVVVHVKARDVRGGAVLHVEIDKPLAQPQPHALLKVPLAVARGRLDFRIGVVDQDIPSRPAVHKVGDQPPGAVAVGTPRAHPQVPKMPVRHLGHRPPAWRPHGHFSVTCPTAIGRVSLGQHLALHLRASVGKPRSLGHKMHHPTQGVAAVQHAARAHDHVGALDGKRVHGAGVLNVPCTVDGVVHPDAVHDQQDPVRLETSQHGADAALLAHLKVDLT